MEGRDSVELVAAFAVGAILGVGATLLLRPEPPLPRKLAARLGGSGTRLGRRARQATRAAGAAGETLTGAGRQLLEQFRGEMAEAVTAAREQLAQDVYDQLRGARAERHGRSRRSRR